MSALKAGAKDTLAAAWATERNEKEASAVERKVTWRGRGGAHRIVSHANAGDLVQVGAVRGADDEELGEELLQRLVANVCGGGKHRGGGGGDRAHLVHGVVQVTCASGEHVTRGGARRRGSPRPSGFSV